MAKHLKNKRDALFAKLRQDFPLEILMIAMGMIKAHRAGQRPTQEGEPETFFAVPVADPDQELAALHRSIEQSHSTTATTTSNS
jgi:hypothetical protein